MPGEQHHYVPRFLLKNFVGNRKGQIHVFDKKDGRRFCTNVKNVAGEKGFYDLAFNDSVFTIEPELAKLESDASVPIRKLIDAGNLGTLDESNKSVIAVFLATQFARTKEHRLRFEHVGLLLAEKLRAMGASEDNIAEVASGVPGHPHDKAFGLRAILESHEFIPFFLNKACMLLSTSKQHPFYISDNPVALRNTNQGPTGGLGLGAEGIEIFLPLSSTLCLCLLCPTIAAAFEKRRQQLALIEQLPPELIPDDQRIKLKPVQRFCEGLASGKSVEISEEHVTNMNALQVMHSSRYIFCESDSFELVETMLRDNNAYRTGLRPTVS